MTDQPTHYPKGNLSPDDHGRLGGFVLDLNLRRLPAGEDELIFELDCMPYRSNSSGFLHGGMVATLVDCTAGLLAYEGVDETQMTATTSLTLHYLSPVKNGPARSTARILRRGRRTIVVEVEVHDADSGEIAAAAMVSFAVLKRLPHEGTVVPPGQH